VDQVLALDGRVADQVLLVGLQAVGEAHVGAGGLRVLLVEELGRHIEHALDQQVHLGQAGRLLRCEDVELVGLRVYAADYAEAVALVDHWRPGLVVEGLEGRRQLRVELVALDLAAKGQSK